MAYLTLLPKARCMSIAIVTGSRKASEVHMHEKYTPFEASGRKESRNSPNQMSEHGWSMSSLTTVALPQRARGILISLWTRHRRIIRYSCCITSKMAGNINPSKCKKDTIKSRLKLPRYLHPVRRIFISISLSPRYRRMCDVWRKVNGYHFGVMCCAWTSAVVLVINLTVTIWSVKKFGIVDGLGTFQTGDCGSTSRIGFWLHLIINGLSTLLLGASNYSMQCLSAPTRSEIDVLVKAQILDNL